MYGRAGSWIIAGIDVYHEPEGIVMAISFKPNNNPDEFCVLLTLEGAKTLADQLKDAIPAG